MFGTLKINRCESPELYRRYREYYCGLCSILAHDYGPVGRMVLNYDVAFFYMLITAAAGSEVQSGKVFCPVSPLRKKDAAINKLTGAFAAASNVYLAGMKLRDDIHDGGRVSKKLLYRLFRRKESAAVEYFNRMKVRVAYAEELFERQRKTEAAAETRDWQNAEAFGATSGGDLSDFCGPTELGLGFMFSEAGRALGVAGTGPEVLGQVGRALGRITYILDSFVDYPSDVRCGRFNALAEAFGDRITLDTALPVDVREALLDLLLSSVNEVKQGIDQLDLGRERDLVEAVIEHLQKRIDVIVRGTRSMAQLENRVKSGSFSYLITHPGHLLRSRAAYRYRGNAPGCCCCGPSSAGDLCTAAICCDAADCDCDAAEGCAQGDCCEFMECCG